MQRTERETIPPQSVRYANVRKLAQSVLRHTVEARRAGNPPSIANLRRSLRPVCDSAREEGLRVEHLLIIVKQAWDHLVEMGTLDRRDSDAPLNEVITQCIKEFYRTGHANMGELTTRDWE